MSRIEDVIGNLDYFARNRTRYLQKREVKEELDRLVFDYVNSITKSWEERVMLKDIYQTKILLYESNPMFKFLKKERGEYKV